MFEMIIGIIALIINPELSFLSLYAIMIVAFMVLFIFDPKQRTSVIVSLQHDALGFIVLLLVLEALGSGLLYGIVYFLG